MEQKIEFEINNRKIRIIEYSTESNWIDQIPNNNWVCLLIDNERANHYINEINSKIIEKNVCYVCAIGTNGERNHDLLDEEIAYREADNEKLYLPKHLLITTWHDELEEGLFFGIYTTHHESVNIEEVVILDLTEGKLLERIKRTIGKIENEE